MEAISVAANIIAVVHLTAEIIDRLSDFKNTVSGIPRTLQAISNELPTLKLVLKKHHDAIEEGRIAEDSQEALKPIITGLEEHIRAIVDIIDKLRPKDPSRMTRNLKAVASFRYDGQIQHHVGAIRGYVSTLSLERVVSGPGKDLAALQRPLVPRFVCPYSRDPDLIERALLADVIAQRRPGSRHALVGGAGMGKSQLAISYGYRIQESAPDTWIFWIDAETISNFEQGYRDIANALRLRGRNDDQANILSLVYEWLRDTANGNWVLIIDNADDKDVFISPPSNQRPSDSAKQISSYIPQSANGSILITSRSRDAAFNVTCNYKYHFAVDRMTEDEALTLLENQLDESHADHDKKRLVERLDYVPLAIAQAGAYISRRSLPVSDYLQELNKGSETSASLLDESLPQLHRNSQRSNSIVATWKVTFEYVRTTAPSAARLLSLMCLFDRQDIPATLLKEQYGEEVNARSIKSRRSWWQCVPLGKKCKGQSQSPKTLPTDFEDDWLMLRDFSLIKPNKDRNHFSMHPMVLFTTRKWLVLHNRYAAWTQHFISIMDTNFPVPNVIYHSSHAPLLAHAHAAVAYRPEDKFRVPLTQWASITNEVANYHDRIGAFDLAQKLYRVAAEGFETSLGPSASQTLSCLTSRALLLGVLSQDTEAEAILRHVLNLKQNTLGPEHPSTLSTLNDLSDFLANRSRDSPEAEQLLFQMLSTRLRVFGGAHPATQSSLQKCGMYLAQRGRHDEAYEVFRRAHSFRSQVSDKADDEWARDLEYLGWSTAMRDKNSLAEKYLSAAIAEKKKDSDRESGMMKTATQLARIYACQEKWLEAQDLFRQVIAYNASHPTEVVEKKFDPAIPSLEWELLMAIVQMFPLPNDAASLAEQCLRDLVDEVGSDHRDLVEPMGLVARVWERAGRWEDARGMYVRAVEGGRKFGYGNVRGWEEGLGRCVAALREEGDSEEEGKGNVVGGAKQVEGEDDDTIGGAWEGRGDSVGDRKEYNEENAKKNVELAIGGGGEDSTGRAWKGEDKMLGINGLDDVTRRDTTPLIVAS